MNGAPVRAEKHASPRRLSVKGGGAQVVRALDSAVIARPIVKWAGGKSGLLAALRPFVPNEIGTYVEPFAGGAALFFALASEKPRPFKKAILVDQNEDLVACYRAVKENVDEIIALLKELRYDSDEFYKVREQDSSKMTDAQRGARLIYLNKTCFNGLWRVNSKGKFNVPFGRMTNPRICDEVALRAASRALVHAKIVHGDFERPLAKLGAGDFVYFDPPYVPLSKTANFTAYARQGFGEEDQARLVRALHDLRERKIGALLSNADNDETRALYKELKHETVAARRSINSDSKKRGPASELIVQNELRVRVTAKRKAARA